MKKAEPYFLLAPAYLLIGAFIFYPMVTVFLLSLQEYRLMDPLNTPFVGFKQYSIILSDEYFWSSLWNSVIWVVVSLLFQALLGFVLALLLNSARFRARGIYQAIVFAPWAVSGFLVAIIWTWLLTGEYGLVNDLLIRLGLIDQKIGCLSRTETALFACVVANIWFGVTFFAVMLLAALRSIPPNLYEVADMDGASAWQSFWRVTAPILKPVIVITILLRAIWIFNWADLIWVMTGGGPAGVSRTLALYIFQKAFLGLDFGYSAALGVTLTVICLAFTAIFLRATKIYEEQAVI